MQAARSLVELGISLAPVPGLKPAFVLLTAIWDNVQQAATNKNELRNLAGSAEDILTSVSLVLSRGKNIDEHIQRLLEKLTKVMEDFLHFTKNHVNMSLFKAFIRNVDVAGEIQTFQRRLQNSLMAFIVASFGAFDSAQNTIQSQLQELISRGHQRVIEQRVTQQYVPPQPSSSLVPSSIRHSPSRSSRASTPKGHSTHITDHDTENSRPFVKASFSKPFRIEIRNKGPVMTTRQYEEDIDFLYTGLKSSDSLVTRMDDSFRIARATDSKISTWMLSGKVISLSIHDSNSPDLHESIDIVFPVSSSAKVWFSWLQAYASTRSLGPPGSHPRPNDVTVRKQYNCWIQKTPTDVIRRRPYSEEWEFICSGHAQSARSHPSHIVYVGPGLLSFSMVYRSGDTIVREHFVHANDEEPTTTSRIHFNSEQEALDWYSVWNSTILLTGQNIPLQVEISTSYSGTLLISNETVVVASPALHPVDLGHWGILNSKSSVTRTHDKLEIATVTTSWSWTIRNNRIVINTTIVSQPGWFDNLEITFADAKSSKSWFEYFAQVRAIGELRALFLPPSENIAIMRKSVCWMHKRKQTIMTLTAMSDQWRPIIKPQNCVEIRDSHIVLESSSILPYTRISMDGKALDLTRQSSASDSRCSVVRRYLFGSQDEAKRWFESIKNITAGFTPSNR